MPTATGNFKTTINNYLQKRASDDELFKNTLAKEGKNLDDCVTYILNQVQKSGQMGYCDDEIFGMAVHYYDEDGIEIGKANANAKVIVNHTIELSQAEKDDVKKKAQERAIAQYEATLVKKPVAKKSTAPTQQPTLF